MKKNDEIEKRTRSDQSPSQLHYPSDRPIAPQPQPTLGRPASPCFALSSTCLPVFTSFGSSLLSSLSSFTFTFALSLWSSSPPCSCASLSYFYVLLSRFCLVTSLLLLWLGFQVLAIFISVFVQFLWSFSLV